jgi:hypothetical protein
MSVFAMPKHIIKVISSLTRSFLWKGTSTSHGIFKVAWHRVIKSKSFGGLGLRSIYNKNLALLFKWLWNLDKGVAGGWQEHILLKYRPHFMNGIPAFTGSLSPTWHGIVSTNFSTQNIANLLHLVTRGTFGFGLTLGLALQPLSSSYTPDFITFPSSKKPALQIYII